MGKEYIEREEALKLREVFSDRKNGNKDFLDGIETAIEFVQNLPAADVVEVRHGRWEEAEDDYFGLHIIKCSECREEWCFEVDDDVKDLNYNYCPHCGCKMDKGE